MLGFGKKTTGKLAVFYCLWLIALFLLCLGYVGREGILKVSEEYGKSYAVLFFPSDRENVEKAESLRIVCLGDSAFFFPAYGGDPRFGRPEDTLPAILERTLRAREQGADLSVVEWSFRGADMYGYYCAFYKARESSPHLVIIPINWTTFGSWWRRLRVNKFPELCALAPLRDDLIPDSLNPIRAENISPFRQLRHKIGIWHIYPYGVKQWVLSGWESLMGVSPPEPEETDLDRPDTWRKDLRKGSFQLLYPMAIHESDEGIRNIRAVANLASRHQTKLLSYMSPINIELMERKGYFDKERFEASKKLIIEAARARGVYCLDLSDLLEDRYFPDRTAHYTLEGRQKICDALAPVITDLLKDDLREFETAAARAPDRHLFDSR